LTYLLVQNGCGIWFQDLREESFIPLSVLRQVYSPFQSKFSTECDLVLPFSIYCTLSFP